MPTALPAPVTPFSTDAGNGRDGLVCIDPRVDGLWRELALRERSDVFHSPGWIDAVCATYGFQARALVLSSADVPLAGVPYAVVDDALGERLVSLPFSDYCDPLVATVDQWRRLLDRLLAEGLPISTRCLHTEVPIDEGRLAVVKRARWHGIDLSGDLEGLWRGLHGSSRQGVRRAESLGVEVRLAGDESDLRAFYDLHLGVRKRKYRMLAQPFAFFQNLSRHFLESNNGCLMLARRRGQLLAGVLFLEWKDTLYYKFNASCLEGLGVRPNDLLLWRGIEYASDRGLAHLDLGLSDWDQEGLVRYKRKYASREKTISYLRHPGPGAAFGGQAAPGPSDGALRQLLPQLTDLFTDDAVPDAITARAGTLLYRLFA